MRASLVVAVLACAGCDRLFGLGTIPSPAPDGATSADRGAVHGQYLQLWAQNDAAGNAAEIQRPFPIDQITALATLDDGSTRTVTIADSGFSFTTPNAGDHYSLRFATPSQASTFDLAATELVLVERTTKRPDDPPAPPMTILAFDLSARHSENNAKEELVTTGTWSRHQVTTNVEVDCSAPDSTGAVIDMLSPHDGAFYTSTQAVGAYVRIMYAAQARDVATIAGAKATVPTLPIAPQMVNATSCANISIQGTAEGAREMLAAGGGTPVVGWYIGATPGLQEALSTEFPLANGFGAGQTNVMYGNPFGLRVEAVALSYATAPAGAASSVTSIAPVGDCTATTAIPAGQVALASNVRVAGTPIATTGTFVTVPATGNIEIAFDLSSDGTADYYVVHLDQIVGASTLTLEQIVTTAQRVHIPASRLLSTSTYRIRVDAALGFPHASLGDFLTMSETAAISVFQSPTFRPQ